MLPIERLGTNVRVARLSLNKSSSDQDVTDDPDLFDGAPVGLQLMGGRLQEERVIAMLEAVTEALQQYEQHHGIGNFQR